MKTCPICEKELPLSDFYKRNYKSGNVGYSTKCKGCEKEYRQEHYKNNKRMYLDKARRNEKIYLKKSREYVVNYLRDNPCVDCGETDIRVLQFDHLDDKKFAISTGVSNRGFVSYDVLVKEMDKCVVRCANCHIKKTSKDFNYWKESYLTNSQEI